MFQRSFSITLLGSLFLILILSAGVADAAYNWTQQSPSPKPPARYLFNMAYIGDDKVVAFGGKKSTPGYLGDTWVYDFSDDTWTEMSPVASPSMRCGD